MQASYRELIVLARRGGGAQFISSPSVGRLYWKGSSHLGMPSCPLSSHLCFFQLSALPIAELRISSMCSDICVSIVLLLCFHILLLSMKSLMQSCQDVVDSAASFLRLVTLVDFFRHFVGIKLSKQVKTEEKCTKHWHGSVILSALALHVDAAAASVSDLDGYWSADVAFQPLSTFVLWWKSTWWLSLCSDTRLHDFDSPLLSRRTQWTVSTLFAGTCDTFVIFIPN